MAMVKSGCYGRTVLKRNVYLRLGRIRGRAREPPSRLYGDSMGEGKLGKMSRDS